MSWARKHTVDWFQEYFRDEDRRGSDERSSLLVAKPQELDLHLSYSGGLEKGPIIQRSGDSSSTMEDPEMPGSYTTDPDRQRIGTYYIRDEKQESHSEELFIQFAGSYILHSALPEKPRPSRKIVEGIFRDHFSGLKMKTLDNFLNNSEFADARVVGKLYRMIADSVKVFRVFLDENRSEDSPDTDPSGFVKKLAFFGTDAEALVGRRAEEVLGRLYSNYPHFQINFDQHKDEDGFRLAIERNVAKFLRLFIMSRNARSHEQQAKERSQDPIVLMQGCGDLTMNLWNVAFVSGPSYHGEGGAWDLLHPPDEPLNDREYTCLIKWKCTKGDDRLKTVAGRQRIVHPYQIRLR